MTKFYTLLFLIPVLLYSQYDKVQLDNNFANNGIYTAATSESDEVGASKILPDGKILFFRSDNVTGGNGETLSRHLPNGTIDTTFGNNGYVYTKNFTAPTPANTTYFDSSILFANDGSIYISNYKFQTLTSQIVKLNANGTINTSFGTNGKLTLTNTYVVNYSGRNQIELSNGNLLFEVTYPNGNTYNLLCLTKNGATVTSFGNNGILSFSQNINSIYSVNNQFYIITDEYFTNDSTKFSIKRFNNNSTSDSSFQTIVTSGLHSTSQFLNNDSLNNLYVITNYQNETDDNVSSEIRKYTSEGLPITNFGNNGLIFNPHYGFISIIFDSNDNPLFCGVKDYGNLYNPIIAKYSKSGILDTKFNQTGYYEELNSSLGYYLDFAFNPLANNEIITSGVADNTEIKFLAKYKLTPVLSTKETDNSKIQFYPNPAQDFISIENIKNQTDLEIYDMQGKLVKREKYKNAQISVTDLSKGVYLLRIPSENYSQKLIVE